MLAVCAGGMQKPGQDGRASIALHSFSVLAGGSRVGLRERNLQMVGNGVLPFPFILVLLLCGSGDRSCNLAGSDKEDRVRRRTRDIEQNGDHRFG